jgi:hypothetical protein
VWAAQRTESSDRLARLAGELRFLQASLPQTAVIDYTVPKPTAAIAGDGAVWGQAQIAAKCTSKTPASFLRPLKGC